MSNFIIPTISASVALDSTLQVPPPGILSHSSDISYHHSSYHRHYPSHHHHLHHHYPRHGPPPPSLSSYTLLPVLEPPAMVAEESIELHDQDRAKLLPPEIVTTIAMEESSSWWCKKGQQSCFMLRALWKFWLFFSYHLCSLTDYNPLLSFPRIPLYKLSKAFLDAVCRFLPNTPKLLELRFVLIKSQYGIVDAVSYHPLVVKRKEFLCSPMATEIMSKSTVWSLHTGKYMAERGLACPYGKNALVILRKFVNHNS